jgi:hypothetical protein
VADPAGHRSPAASRVSRHVPPTSDYPMPLTPGTRVRRLVSGELGVVLDTVFRNGIFPVQYTNGQSAGAARREDHVGTDPGASCVAGPRWPVRLRARRGVRRPHHALIDKEVNHECIGVRSFKNSVSFVNSGAAVAVQTRRSTPAAVSVSPDLRSTYDTDPTTVSGVTTVPRLNLGS